MHFKQRQDREQMMIFSYESLIPLDNPVRLIDLMCKKFIKDNPWREEWKGKNQKGRKSYPPSQMLGLLIYGYFNGISSSRRIERETHRNIEVLWLMEGLQPDHWTICEFRRDNKQLIKDLLKRFRQFLLSEGHACGKKIVFDGSKIKAYASREMLSSESIGKKLENPDRSIAEYLSQLENNDSQEGEPEVARGEIKKLKEKIEKLESRKVKLKGLEEELEASGKQQIAPNDKDAVLVKGRDGKFAGYNAQTRVEGKEHFIMHSKITTEENDIQQLESCVDLTIEETSVVPEEVLADKGYGNTTQILNVEESNIKCYVPLSQTGRDKEEKKGLVFKYNKQDNTYTCPQGKELQLYATNRKSRSVVYDVYKCHECQDCPIRQECTGSKTGRTYKRNVDREKIDRYTKRLESDYAKERILERKGIVEHPFGTIKWLMGKFNFLLTGTEKTQIELNLYATAYNLKRLMNCGQSKTLMGQMSKYDWKMA